MLRSASAQLRFALVVGVLLSVVLCGVGVWLDLDTAETVTITVTDKQPGTGTNRYLVWATVQGAGDETFTVKDDLAHGQFRPEEVYGHLRVGGTYTVRVNGVRYGPTRLYRNIFQIVE